MNIPLLPPTLFWFPARDWFTPHWESHSNVLPYLSHLFLPLRQVKCSPHCLEGPLSSFYQLNSAQGLSSLKPPSDYPIYSPSLYPCPLERIPSHMFIPTLLDVFCAFSCIWYVWDPGRERCPKAEAEAPVLWSSQKFPWGKKSGLKTYHVLWVGRYLRRYQWVILVLSCLAHPHPPLLCWKDQRRAKEGQGEGGGDVPLLPGAQPQQDWKGWGKGQF